MKTCFLTTILITTWCWESKYMSIFNLLYINQYTPLLFRRICLKTARKQIFWRDITSVLIWGKTKNQCWRRRYLVDMFFMTPLYVDFIYIYATLTWGSYDFATCVLIKKLHIVRNGFLKEYITSWPDYFNFTCIWASFYGK